MDRKEFLSTLGLGAAAIACSYCFGGCQSSEDVAAPPTNVDFTLDLNDPAYSTLKTNGNFIYKDGIIVTRTASGEYVAVSSTCTHEGNTVQYAASGNRFNCPRHGSNFATDGSVINGPAARSLAKYNTSLNGTSLRVFS